uniref:DENN domain-containing 5B isoform X1 n=1 Tax=Tetranychus evansi TaxID=178897 RepID=A0A3G5APL0_9ACAR|nr:DENN domain-containing 5B isoform X1 [Tetranychus evansi]
MSCTKKKERQKLIKCFLILKPSEKDRRKIIVVTKYCPPPTGSSNSGTTDGPQDESNTSSGDKSTQIQSHQSSGDLQKTNTNQMTVIDDIDESSLTLFCLPNGGEVSSTRLQPSFHSFLITKQNGSRVYGSTLTIWERIKTGEDADRYINKALCFLTSLPFVAAMHKLLLYIYENNCSLGVVQSICDLKMPSRGKCMKLKLPKSRYIVSYQYHQQQQNQQATNSENQANSGSGVIKNCLHEEIYIYRGLSSFPLFDYPLRQLFVEILTPEQFLNAFIATLLEYQLLIISESYYKLMMVAEALTSLLLPFSWQHVYVPILPTKLGLHFLDAPTPYIMGINSSSRDAANISSVFSGSTASSIQCRIDCDTGKIDYFFDEDAALEDDLLTEIPPFIEELKIEIESILSSESRLQGLLNFSGENSLSMPVKVKETSSSEFTYLDDLKLNQSLRIAFLKCIKKNILSDHEKFIVTTSTRKDAVTFDAVSYLCDQPDSTRNFLSKFLKTQMFVSFIDESVKKMHKSKQSIYSSQQSLMITSSYGTEEMDEPLLGDADLDGKFFNAREIPFTEVVIDPLVSSSNDLSNSRLLASPMRRRRPRTPASETSSLRRGRTTSESGDDDSQQQNNANDVLSSPFRVPTALAAQTNWKVVESLLREIKVRTKRILLAKMGNEEIAPLGVGSPEDMEENTLIASLCDLIERIWSHARANDKEIIRCSFWSHVVAFTTLQREDGDSSQIDSSLLTPALAWVLLRKRIDSLSRMSIDSGSSSSISNPPSPSKDLSSSNDYLKPIPNTFYYDYKSVQSMKDIKTEIGKSRAFIRLALERKLLSKHLRVLLSNQELVSSMYKRYAFLRCEEEREQFLTHLLTLNAVDILCFTNTFSTSSLTYTLVIEGSGPLTGWILLSGTLAQSSEIALTNISNIFTFKHINLGLINSLTISVSLSTKIFIGHCFVRNEVTGHLFKFVCHRWFGRNIEDGATERVLLGEVVSNSCIGEILKKSQTRSSSIGRHWARSTSGYREESLEVQELQQMLGEIVNEMVRLYYNHYGQTFNNHSTKNDHHRNLYLSPLKKNVARPTRNHPSRSSNNLSTSTYSSRLFNNRSSIHQKTLVTLIFGEKQLLWTLLQIFYYDFKRRSRSSFRKQIFLWDYLLAIICELKISETREPVMDKMISLVETISVEAANWGKDSKFQLFLILSIRDHYLTKFLKYLSKPHMASQYYEANSFLRNPILMTSLLQILGTFDEMKLSIDSSFTKGL